MVFREQLGALKLSEIRSAICDVCIYPGEAASGGQQLVTR